LPTPSTASGSSPPPPCPTRTLHPQRAAMAGNRLWRRFANSRRSFKCRRRLPLVSERKVAKLRASVEAQDAASKVPVSLPSSRSLSTSCLVYSVLDQSGSGLCP
jgi:hypothetical protein